MDTLGGSSSQGKNNVLVYCFTVRVYTINITSTTCIILYMIWGDCIANVHTRTGRVVYTYIIMYTTIEYIDFMECIFLSFFFFFINYTIHYRPLPNRHTIIQNIGAFGCDAAQAICVMCILISITLVVDHLLFFLSLHDYFKICAMLYYINDLFYDRPSSELRIINIST